MRPSRHGDQVLDFLTKAVEKVETFIKQTQESVQPTPEELADLSLACTRLWDLDFNRLAPGVDYALDLQQVASFNARGRATWSLGGWGQGEAVWMLSALPLTPDGKVLENSG